MNLVRNLIKNGCFETVNLCAFKMGTGKERFGEHSGKKIDYGDDRMKNYDSEDWLVIDEEASTRARNHQRVSPNPAHREWGKPAMRMGRGHGHDQVSWSNFHNSRVSSAGSNYLNIDLNDSVMGLVNGGRDNPIIVVDSSDEDDEEDEVSYSGKSNHVVPQILTSESRGRPNPFTKRNCENCGKNISKENCNDDDGVELGPLF